MPQTLLALLSMVLTTFFAFNQHRNVLSTHLNMIREDMAVRSAGVAVEMMEEIGAHDYDAAIAEDNIFSPNELGSLGTTDPNGGTTETDGGNWGGGTVQNGNEPSDVNFYHGRTEERNREVGDSELRFKIKSKVRYMRDDDPSRKSLTPTKTKEITVMAWSMDIPHADTVRISQIVTCGSRCKW